MGLKSLYHDRIVPHLVYLVCGRADVAALRREVVPQAHGRVLEIGMGAGANLEFYDPAKVEAVLGLEPSEGMRRKAQPALAAPAVPVRWIGGSAEAIPLADESIDTVVLTYTLCSIPDARRALAEMRRVLRPGGLLVFAEHGRDPDPKTYRRQRLLEPAWKRVMGGCHLTRCAPDLLAEAGFRLEARRSVRLDRMPKFGALQYLGTARRA